VHIDIKHLPKLQTANGERRKRYLYAAIDRRSRSVHLAVKDDETEKSAIAFLREAAAAFPFRLTHVLTDNGSCFTPAFAGACAALGAEHRHTRPRSPHTNGMVERFNGRVGSEVLGITIWSHRDLERLLRGFDAAYNARRQRVLDGKTPDQVVAERLEARRKLLHARPHGRAGPADIAAARRAASPKPPRRSRNQTRAPIAACTGTHGDGASSKAECPLRRLWRLGRPDAFELEHTCLRGRAARCGKAADPPAGGENAVAGDDQRDRVLGHRLSHIPRHLRPEAEPLG
jgi:hypothetical protein